MQKIFFDLLCEMKVKMDENKKKLPIVEQLLWALTDSNRRPSACKADALNQLS